MTAARIGFKNTLAATILGLGVAVVPATTVHAQQVMVMEGSWGLPIGSVGGNRVTSKSIDAYGRLLGFDQDQTEIARELHQQYVTGVDEANQQRRSEMQSLMAEFRESEDHTVLMERMPELTRESDKRLKAIEASLFSDLRLLLDEEQAGRWQRVERLRRRETTLKRGSLSGETIDLMLITESVTGGTDYDAEIAEALERYEMELDRALIAKAKMLEEVKESYSGMTMSFDLTSMEKMGEKTREAGVRVRDVNRRHARVIEALLPEDLATSFRDETKRRTFPRVYRESRVDRLLAAAVELSDLESDQRETVGELTTSYNQDRSAADTRWSAAISKDDEEGGSSFGAGSFSIRMFLNDDEDESPVAKARKDRRALDKRYEERLMAVLNAEQQDLMPKPNENPAQDGRASFISGATRMIIDHLPDRD